ncbi:hypothetical protein O6H91_03G085700 [Diphasiastrum complanatum]|uniref:Uncharacterized protein n=1 Tax=Diphasiastrum complanatum TaxID=34168 RepID=A0ACC2E878_DIPCM|nr:hypothetical protein O6H91_03G085700 [Diphasiastrum complanatum]
MRSKTEANPPMEYLKPPIRMFPSQQTIHPHPWWTILLNAVCEMESTSREVDIDTNPEDVKAPGLFERIKEEVEAVTQDVHGKHDSTDKQHSGFFHHLADKLGIHMQQKGSQSE